jgi:hypothetical protein
MCRRGRVQRIVVGERGRSGGQRGEALERARDGAAPGPVGGQVQYEPAGVAGELAGDVQQPVAMPTSAWLP